MRPAIWPLLYATHAVCFAGALLDDSYISFRYAKNLAAGLGLVFNAGERVEGYTNFAWVNLAALGISLGLSPEWLMQGLSLIAGVTLTFWVTRAARTFDAAGHEDSWIAPLIVATSAALAFYVGSGLETVFFALLLTGGAITLTQRKPLAFAFLTSLAFLTRPEAALLGAFGSALFLRDALRESEKRRPLVVALVTFCLLVLPYLAFKQRYFGDIVPNTLHAKEPRPLRALHYVATGCLPVALLLVPAIGSFFETRIAKSRARSEMFALWALYVLATIMVGPDWMPAHRLLAHVLPLFALACHAPVRDWLSAGGWRRSVAALGLVAFVGAQAHRSFTLFENSRAWPERDELAKALAHKLVARGARSFATINIGLLGYEAPELTVLDLAGLVDPVIGRLAGGHLEKQPDDAYLLSRNPDVYILTSSAPIQRGPGGQGSYVPDWPVEAHVFARPWFSQRYSYAGTLRFFEGYYYHLFERRDLLPPKR